MSYTDPKGLNKLKARVAFEVALEEPTDTVLDDAPTLPSVDLGLYTTGSGVERELRHRLSTAFARIVQQYALDVFVSFLVPLSGRALGTKYGFFRPIATSHSMALPPRCTRSVENAAVANHHFFRRVISQSK